jgi:hypothetical protein
VNPDLKAVEEAEARLESRSSSRRAQLERRDRRRRRLPWILCLLPLPAAGSGALLVLLDSSGGDLRDLSAAGAALAVAACLLVPALISAWIGRRHGTLDAVLWGLVTLAVELALVLGLGFAVLDLGP